MTNKKCLVACAGSGKTSFLVSEVWEHFRDATAIFVTFTTSNQRTICDKIKEKFGYIPSKIKIMGWYEFLFKFFILPYKVDVISSLNVTSISLCFDSDYSRTYQTKDGKRFTKYRKEDKKSKYFTKSWGLHKDLVSEFAVECIENNQNSIIRRLNESATIICFDEAQDFGGADFKILSLISKFYEGTLFLATDPRQHIYSTTKYVGKDGGNIDTYLATKVNTQRHEYVVIDDVTLSYSHRCMDAICQLASEIFPNKPKTIECKCPDCVNRRKTYPFLQGVFAVRESDVELFAKKFSPLNLIYNQSETLTPIGRKMTMGDSKGTESNNVLIYPTEDMAKFIFQNRNLILRPQTQSKLYVSVTRARYLLGIVYRDKYKFAANLIPFWNVDS